MKILMSWFVVIALWMVSASAMTFVHPGTLNSRAELDFIKGQISAGAQPWKGELEQIKNSHYAHMGPHGLTNIDSKSEDANISRYDAAAAYSQALLWYLTGEEAYARSAIAILNSKPTCSKNHAVFYYSSIRTHTRRSDDIPFIPGRAIHRVAVEFHFRKRLRCDLHHLVREQSNQKHDRDSRTDAKFFRSGRSGSV